MSPRYSLPKNWKEVIERRLKPLGFSLGDSGPLSKSILDLSNFFIRASFQSDYWKEDRFRAAYLSYFASLNYVRAAAVFHEAKRLGFAKQATSAVDWGCGTGSASLAMLLEMGAGISSLVGVDKSKTALGEFQDLMDTYGMHGQATTKENAELKSLACDLLILSYSLNEVEEFPQIHPSVKWIAVIEPSTHQAGRRLLQWRDQMVEGEWFAWAPCTHQIPCPLYNRSGKDWCHHRIEWDIPDWFDRLEAHLPMRNNTLTMSYVLLSKEEPPQWLDGLTRVVGDEQKEAGKNRQAICRGPEREFLSWLQKSLLQPGLHRGDLIRISNSVQKSNEVRINLEDDFEIVTGPPEKQD